ncbi:uncharacterized protein [Macrobrachium rosenbergii]|uniref:uncharacterized protein isoform X2 n=1 Tax=Macrobrachium rosenbergii TaxID=79674 RepID=UPI0034D77CE3
MDGTSNAELLELKLEEARKLLRLKKKKLKQYDRRLEAKQHVQETLKRVVEESQNGDTSLDSSSASEPRSNDSRSVKFSDDSPEVIFVTPTPDVYLSKKGRLKEKVKSKGYRSLSLSEKKTGREEESQIEQIPPPDIPQTNAKRTKHCSPSAESVSLEDKVNNNDNKVTEVKDMFQSCEYNRKSSSPILSQHSVISVRVDTQRRSGEDDIKHQNNGDVEKETKVTLQNCHDGGKGSPILSQRSVLSATARMHGSDGDHIKHENDDMIDSENDDFFDQDFSEVIEGKITSPRHPHQNKQIFDDSLNKWISEDNSATSNCKEGASDVAAKGPGNENTELNATFYFNSEWEENDIFEDSAIKKADIEASSIRGAKESPKKYPTKEKESQDLFSSILPTKYDGSGEPKRSYKSKLVLGNQSSEVHEMPKAHFGMGDSELRKESPLASSDKRLVELNAGNEEENIHRRIRTSRVRLRLSKSSNSTDSNGETCKKELLGENVLKGTCSSLREDYQGTQENHSSGRKDLPPTVKCGSSDTVGNIVDPIDHITSVSCNSLETADTQVYSEDFNEEESADTVSKDREFHTTLQMCGEFIKGSSGVCKREDEKLNACISDVSPKSRICGENSLNRKALCSKQLFSKRLSSSKVMSSEKEFPCGGKGSGQCIPGSSGITGENPTHLQDCDRSDVDGDLVCDERVSRFSLKPSDNLGKILSGSHGYFSPKLLERLYIVLVCELGISIWTGHSGDILKNGDNLPTKREGDKGGGGREMGYGNWRVLTEKKHQIGDISGVRHIVAVSLPSDEEEIRCLVAVSRNGDSVLHVIHVQYDLEGGWLITERPIDIRVSCGDQLNHLFGCALSDWSVVLCWNSIKSSPESFLVINFDVSYSRRSKKWELHCNTSLRSPEWSSHLRRFVPLNDTARSLLGKTSTSLMVRLFAPLSFIFS